MFYCIKKNMCKLFASQKLLILIVIFTQIVSIVAILFSYGIINHYNVKNEAVEGKLLKVDIQFDLEQKNVKYHKLKDVYVELFNVVENKEDYIYIMAGCDGHLIDTTFKYENGKIQMRGDNKGLENSLVSGGRVFTDEEFSKGEKVLVLMGKNKYADGKVSLGGEVYTIIGEHTFFKDFNDENYIMPFLSLPDNSYIRHIVFNLNIPLNEKEHNKLSELILTKLDSTAIIPEFEGVNDIENTKTNNTLIVAGILLIVFSAVNYCIMYRYILEKRKKTFAIYRICGCSRGKGVLMYIIELLGTSMIIFGVMVPVYHYVILPKLKGMFEYITEFYSIEKYLMIGVLYFVSLLIAYMILIIGIVRKTPLTLSKEGEI